MLFREQFFEAIKKEKEIVIHGRPLNSSGNRNVSEDRHRTICYNRYPDCRIVCAYNNFVIFHAILYLVCLLFVLSVSFGAFHLVLFEIVYIAFRLPLFCFGCCRSLSAAWLLHLLECEL